MVSSAQAAAQQVPPAEKKAREAIESLGGVLKPIPSLANEAEGTSLDLVSARATYETLRLLQVFIMKCHLVILSK